MLLHRSVEMRTCDDQVVRAVPLNAVPRSVLMANLHESDASGWASLSCDSETWRSWLAKDPDQMIAYMIESTMAAIGLGQFLDSGTEEWVALYRAVLPQNADEWSSLTVHENSAPPRGSCDQVEKETEQVKKRRMRDDVQSEASCAPNKTNWQHSAFLRQSERWPSTAS